LPLSTRWYSQSSLDGCLVEVVGDVGKVIAERRWVTLELDVVIVDVSCIIEYILHQRSTVVIGIIPILILEVLDALLVGLIDLLVGILVDEVILVSEWAVSSILDEGIGPSISDTDSDQVDVEVGIVEVSEYDLSGDCRYVVSSVRLSNNEKVLLGVLWEFLEELLEEGIHVGGNLGFVLDVILISIGESSSDGLINKNKISK